MKLSTLLHFASLSAILIAPASAATTIQAIDNAGLNALGTEDESSTMTLRNRFGYTNSAEKYAYLRFAMDAANDTFGGIAAADITSVTIDLYFTGFSQALGQVYALDDNANPGAGFLTETSWAATGANELNGTIAPHGNEDVNGSSRVTSIGNFASSGLSSTGLFQLPLDLVAFKNMITSSSNDEFTLIIDGPKDLNNAIASLGNATFAKPSLTVTAIPEPSSSAMLASLLGMIALLRRRQIS